MIEVKLKYYINKFRGFNLSSSLIASTALIIIFAICVCGFFLLFDKKDPEKIKKVSALNSNLGIERATQVDINYTDSGVLKAKITAPLMERYPQKVEPYMEMKKGVKGYFYNKEGRVESSLTAEYAISYENRKIIEVRRRVHVKNNRGEALETEKLIWDQRSEKIYTDQFIKIKTADEILYGHGFESNQNFTRYRIKNLKGRVSLK